MATFSPPSITSAYYRKFGYENGILVHTWSLPLENIRVLDVWVAVSDNCSPVTAWSLWRTYTTRGVVNLSVSVREDEIRIFGYFKDLSGSGKVELLVRSFDQITPENLVSGGEAVR